MKILPFIHALSRILAFFSIFPLVNIGFSLGFGFKDVFLREFLFLFIICILPALLFALLSFLGGKKTHEEFSHREAIGVTVFSWILIPILSALPFVMSGNIPSFIDAIFETSSGLSTTGASIFTDIEKIPKPILFWRSMLHFIGGGGIVLASVILLPGLTSKVFQMEIFTPIGEQASPKMMEIGKRVWLTFCSLNALLVFLYLIGGMPLFDALCHAFGAVATGGLSIYNSSFGYYAATGHPSALYFEVVTIIFMFLGATPFLLLYELLRGNFRGYFGDAQLRFYLFYCIVLSLIISLNLFTSNVYPTIGESIRHSFFAFFSISSTTGYGTEDFTHWPNLTKMILLLSMFVGGSTTSTSGGIKILRLIFLLKVFFTSIKQLVHPSVVYNTRIGNSKISLEMSKSITNFMVCFFMVVIGGFLWVSHFEKDFLTAFASVVSSIASVGPGITKEIGPMGNFAAFQPESKVVLSILMILGRIEIIPIFAIFLPRFWRK